MRLRVQRPASSILGLSVGLGLLLVVGSAVIREIRRSREAAACDRGDAQACADACYGGRDAACRRIERSCAAGDARHCEAGRAVERARKRWSRR